MTSTPPPPRRIHTPPTPLHGPKYDDYEPYSPRRSSRVAARTATPSPRFASSPLSKGAATPPSTIRNPRTRNSNLSPPSSISSQQARSKRGRRGVSPLPQSDSDTDILPEKVTAGAKEAHRKTSSRDSFGMLNTPAKTPSRKRPANTNGAARLLFGDNEGLLDPTPSRRKRGADLFGMLEDDQMVAKNNGIEIYTDSKERRPEMDEDEANPFLSRNAGKAAGKAKSKRKSTQERQIEEQVRNDEGMVYVFRGKKIFRKYDSPPQNTHTGSPLHTTALIEDDDNLSDDSIRRRAGPAASRPFTRSTVKPRLLFPSEDQKREREERANLADEEALTDIEMPRPSNKVSTPTKQTRFADNVTMTPPTTVRGKKAKSSPADEQLQHELEDRVEAEVPKTKRRGPFDSFQRKKVTSLAGKGAKREGSPVNGEGAAKRTRSGVHS